MSDPIIAQSREADARSPRPAGSRRRKRPASSCLTVLVVLIVLGGLLCFGVSKGVEAIQDRFADPEDFAGPGTGAVTFQVNQGDSASQIGQNLKAEGVVASVDAFVAAADDNPESAGIQVGYYALKKEMKAEDVVQVLVDPANLISTSITFPEGETVAQILDRLAKSTDFKRGQFAKVLENTPDKIGLPDYAGGNAEGYLFPSSYGFGPDATPTSILKTMVDRWRQAADDADLEGAAERLGYTPHELMTIASLVEAEARGDDMPKVSRVIYNRLENPGTAGTIGRLDIDATVNYALGRNVGVALSEEDLQVDSPYNTRLYKGLPPGPIEAPGDAAIQATAAPAEGDWYYYVTVNLKTGETKFAETPSEFDRYKSEYLEYCETSKAC